MWNVQKLAGPQKGSLCHREYAGRILLLRSRESFTAVRLICLAGYAVLRAPLEIAVDYGVLAKVAAAELVVWSQCGSRIGCLVRVRHLG
jgi:CRISPR/Cas system-associated exonuclease Cas4 (RecB family)